MLVNYGSHELIAKNVDAPSFAEARLLVVIVDNFSSVAERHAITELCTDRGWTLLTGENEGFGAGVNKGATEARRLDCEVLIALNPDARATADTLSQLAFRVSSDPSSLISPRMEDSHGRPHFIGATVNMTDGQIKRGWHSGDTDPVWKNWLSGACLAIHLDTFEGLGGFDTSFFLYWEDLELSRRAVQVGMKLELASDILVVHDEGGTHNRPESRAKSPTYYFYNTRNRLLFAAQHAHRDDRWRWLLTTPRQSLLIWLRGGKKQLFISPRGAWAALRGTLSGLLVFVRSWRNRQAHPAGS